MLIIQTYNIVWQILDDRYSKVGHGSNLVVWLGTSQKNYKNRNKSIYSYKRSPGWKTRNGADLKLQSTTGALGHPCNLWFDLIYVLSYEDEKVKKFKHCSLV